MSAIGKSDGGNTPVSSTVNDCRTDRTVYAARKGYRCADLARTVNGRGVFIGEDIQRTANFADERPEHGHIQRTGNKNAVCPVVEEGISSFDCLHD